MSRHLAAAVFIVLTMCAGTVSAERPGPCETDTSYATLDFLLGDWNVYVEKELIATDHIERILAGCAVMEDWTAASGSQGKGFFYYQKATGLWKYLWVRDNSPKFGGCKEKVLTERYDNGGVRFEGKIPAMNNGHYFERTTLTPLPDGSIRQVIEVSQDNESWRKLSDVRYVRK
jgi:hypothetical protein